MSVFIMDALRKLPYKPRWHGNGFVQLQLNERQRLHVWGLTTKPKPENNAYIHNHVWHMDSHVLWGNLNHQVFGVEVEEHAGHYLWDVKDGGKKFAAVGRCSLSERGSYFMSPGSHYQFPAAMFHATRADNAVTIITKTSSVNAWPYPRVVTPLGQEPYNAHGDDGMSEDDMWYAIDSALVMMDHWGWNQIEKVLA